MDNFIKREAYKNKRLESLRRELEPLLEEEGEIFRAYVRGFYSGRAEQDDLYRLKYEHSLEVLRKAWLLIGGEEELREPQSARALLLAALYHDIGRFEQLERYHSFVDKESIDHALAGSKRLAELRFMPAQPPALRRAVRAAVLLHSRAELPPGLRRQPSSPLALAARALRDADKLDIIRVMQEELERNEDSQDAVYLGLADRPLDYSPRAAQSALEGRSILSGQMRTRNDFRLRLCGWVRLFEFPSALRILARSGYMEKILAELPDDAVISQVREMVRNKLAT